MPDTSQHQRPLRVASYNIRKAKGVDRRYDPGRIVDILAGLEADVVAVQEVDFRWRDRPCAISPAMIAANTDYDIVPVGAGDSLGFHGNALLVRRDTLVGQVTRLDLPGLEPRGALRVDLGLGGGISIVATHLGLTRYHRQRQLAAIRAALDPDVQASVILGDFNEWSATRGLDPLQPDFTVHAPGKSFHAALPVAALDRIAISHDMALHDAGVVQHAQALKASDHLPIWADLVVNRRKPD